MLVTWRPVAGLMLGSLSVPAVTRLVSGASAVVLLPRPPQTDDAWPTAGAPSKLRLLTLPLTRVLGTEAMAKAFVENSLQVGSGASLEKVDALAQVTATSPTLASESFRENVTQPRVTELSPRAAATGVQEKGGPLYQQGVRDLHHVWRASASCEIHNLSLLLLLPPFFFFLFRLHVSWRPSSHPFSFSSCALELEMLPPLLSSRRRPPLGPTPSRAFAPRAHPPPQLHPPPLWLSTDRMTLPGMGPKLLHPRLMPPQAPLVKQVAFPSWPERGLDDSPLRRRPHVFSASPSAQ